MWSSSHTSLSSLSYPTHARTRSFVSSRNREQISALASPSNEFENSGLSFSKESNISKNLNSLWGSFLLLATPSPNRKKTAMILSAILTSILAKPRRPWLFPELGCVVSFLRRARLWLRLPSVESRGLLFSSRSPTPSHQFPLVCMFFGTMGLASSVLIAFLRSGCRFFISFKEMLTLLPIKKFICWHRVPK